LSGAILYVAIVAIWAFVLVPRWLRRSHVQPPAVPVPVSDGQNAAAEYDGYSDLGYREDEEYACSEAAPDVQAFQHDWDDQGGPADQPVAAGPADVPVLARGKVLQARRRVLTMLVLMTAAAGACPALKVAPSWACIPPAVLLGVYLLLLREAALADAEQARRRTAMEWRIQAARQRAHKAWEAQQFERTAQIIDISDRVGDQLYDQYADATIRAVGD
jgi:hypothetical protein